MKLGQFVSGLPSPRTGTAEQVVKSFMAEHDAPGEGTTCFRMMAREGEEEIDLVVRATWKQVGGRDVVWTFELLMPFENWCASRG